MHILNKYKYYLASLSTIALGYSLSLISTRILTIQDRAILGVALVLFSSFNPLCLFGIQNGIIKFGTNMSCHSVRFVFIFHILINAFVLILLNYFYWDRVPHVVAFIGSLIAAFNLINTLISSFGLSNDVDFLTSLSFLNLISQLLSLFLMVICVFSLITLSLFDSNEYSFLFPILSYYLISTLLFLVVVLNKLVKRAAFKKYAVRVSDKNVKFRTGLARIYKFSAITFPSHIGLNDAIPVLPWLIADTGEGLLTAAFFAFNFCVVIPKALMNISTRKDYIYHSNQDNSPLDVFRKSAKKSSYFLFSLVVVFFIILLSQKFMVPLVFGSSYKDAVSVPGALFFMGIVLALKMFVTNLYKSSSNAFKSSFKIEIIASTLHLVPYVVGAAFIGFDIPSFVAISYISSFLMLIYLLFVLANLTNFFTPLSLFSVPCGKNH